MLFGNDFVTALYMIPILLFSVAVHECMHAVAAYKLGDRSQRLQGRMTLDPFVHLDILGFISILLVGFGWGKPVYIDDTNFKNKSRDNMLVSLAGPLSNLGLAIIFTLIFKVLIITNILQIAASSTIASILVTMLYLSIIFNVTLAIFNMLPFPPFDGSKVLLHFLPYKGKEFIYNLQQYSFYIIIILFATGILGYILNPLVNGVTNLINIFLNL